LFHLLSVYGGMCVLSLLNKDMMMMKFATSKQDAVGNGRLADFAFGVAVLNSANQRPLASDLCCHLANSTKHTCRLWFCPFALLYRHMTSSAKPEVHNVSDCCQRRTDPWPRVTCTKNLVKFGHVVFEICGKQTDKQTYRRAYCDISHSYMRGVIKSCVPI